MKLTNKFNLPNRLFMKILADVANDPYKHLRDTAQVFRVTELSNPPLPKSLWNKYIDTESLVIDASFFLTRIFGTAVHLLLDEPDTSETRYNVKMSMDFEYNCRRVVVAGTADEVTETEDMFQVVDNKTVMTSNASYPVRDETVYQLNIYAFLLGAHKTGKKIDLKARYLYKDFQPKEAYRNPTTYPQAMMWLKDVPVLDAAQVETYIWDKLEDHMSSPFRNCTDSERSYGQCRYAVTHPERERAIRVLDNYADAIAFVEGMAPKLRTEARIELRDKDLRCNAYCDAVSCCPYAHEMGYSQKLI